MSRRRVYQVIAEIPNSWGGTDMYRRIYLTSKAAHRRLEELIEGRKEEPIEGFLAEPRPAVPPAVRAVIRKGWIEWDEEAPDR